MCPVPRIAFVLAADPDLAIPGDGTARDEVIPVNIVDIAVPVVVGTRSPVFLLRIDPHVRRKVGMRIFHALIHDGNHHAGVTGRDRQASWALMSAPARDVEATVLSPLLL